MSFVEDIHAGHLRGKAAVSSESNERTISISSFDKTLIE